MRTLLSKWLPNRKFGKFLKNILIGIGIVLFLAFLVLPFCRFPAEIMRACKWIWLGCAVVNLDNFAEYKRAKEQRKTFPIMSLYIILTFVYLYTYWHLLSLPVVICGSVIIGIIEFTVSVSIYKTIRFTDEQKLEDFSPKIIHGVQLGGLYIFSLALFLLGIFESKVLLYIFGGIALLLLAGSILISLSNGLSVKKNVFNVIIFVIDVLSFLTLIIYLIYVIPEEFASLQSIITTIVAAVLGGAITIAGVAWTIKKTEKDRRKDELDKAAPIFTDIPTNFYSYKDKPDIITDIIKICFNSKHEDWKKETAYAAFQNSDNSWFYIESILLPDGKTIFPEGGKVVLKNKLFLLQISVLKFYLPHYLILITADKFHNKFYYKMEFKWEKIFGNKIPILSTFAEVQHEDMKNLISEKLWANFS